MTALPKHLKIICRLECGRVRVYYLSWIHKIFNTFFCACSHNGLTHSIIWATRYIFWVYPFFLFFTLWYAVILALRYFHVSIYPYMQQAVKPFSHITFQFNFTHPRICARRRPRIVMYILVHRIYQKSHDWIFCYWLLYNSNEKIQLFSKQFYVLNCFLRCLRDQQIYNILYKALKSIYIYRLNTFILVPLNNTEIEWIYSTLTNF